MRSLLRVVAGNWPGAELLELDSDHATYLMQPEQFATAVEAFALSTAAVPTSVITDAGL